MNNLQKLRLWEHLKKDFLQNIKDTNTRKLYYKTLLIKATKEFGFNPENGNIQTQGNPELTDWEKEFAQDIQDTISYGFDVREEKRKKTLDETRACMQHFISHGGRLSDIPDDILTPDIRELYYRELFRNGDDLARAADDLTENVND